MSEKKIGVINRSVGHGCASARESLDLVLALSAFNESLSLFFMGDGVYQLLENQQPDAILQKNVQPMFKLLDLYDVENVYVCEKSLQQRGLSESQLVIDVIVLDAKILKDKLHQQDQLLSF
ncbi:MAG TPA: sulfurtransferase complex subunit TusC [Psychromonas hadalis]|nr:sulfurtransferase complex subunit TusC [Psychromonas hadalis]